MAGGSSRTAASNRAIASLNCAIVAGVERRVERGIDAGVAVAPVVPARALPAGECQNRWKTVADGPPSTEQHDGVEVAGDDAPVERVGRQRFQAHADAEIAELLLDEQRHALQDREVGGHQARERTIAPARARPAGAPRPAAGSNATAGARRSRAQYLRPDRAVGRHAAPLQALLHERRAIDGEVERAPRRPASRNTGRAEFSITAYT